MIVIIIQFYGYNIIINRVIHTSDQIKSLKYFIYLGLNKRKNIHKPLETIHKVKISMRSNGKKYTW